MIYKDKTVDFILSALMIVSAGVFFALLVFLSSCSHEQNMKWKAAGLSAAKCIAPQLLDSVKETVNRAIGEALNIRDVNYKDLGVELVSKYGVKAAVCTVFNMWSDLGGPGLELSSLAMDKKMTALSWLVNHWEEWAK